MNILVIGLGSMGKRRIRCLQALGIKNIYGFELREDRCKEATEKYSVQCFSDFDKAWEESSPTVAIISVPPAHHKQYMRICVDRNIPFFSEIDLVPDDLINIERDSTAKNLVVAPSNTMCFHPAFTKIQDIVKYGDLGKISNVVFHSGQYLPDWHPYEKVSDFFVSNKKTSGAREILSFELNWLTSIFGFPKKVSANFRKTINIEGAEEIDDTYNCLLDYGDFLSSITIDVVSRYATRRLMINGDKKQLIWEWDADCIRIFNPEKKEWETETYDRGVAAEGYNKNIGENMYIDETKTFLDTVAGKTTFPNSLKKDIEVIALMDMLEKSATESRFISG